MRLCWGLMIGDDYSPTNRQIYYTQGVKRKKERNFIKNKNYFVNLKFTDYIKLFYSVSPLCFALKF